VHRGGEVRQAVVVEVRRRDVGEGAELGHLGPVGEQAAPVAEEDRDVAPTDGHPPPEVEVAPIRGEDV